MATLIKRILLLTVFMLILSGGYPLQSAGRTNLKDIRQLLPAEGEFRDLQLDGEAEHVRGADLHLVINGGAEIFYEYGFQQAVYQTYRYKGEHRINLEIYEMTDPSAAYGIYSFKTDTSGRSLDIGANGWWADYYLIFWKGPYLATIIGLDNSDETEVGILGLAHTIDQKISAQSSPPELLKRLPAHELLPNGITYFRGLLALYNLYPFDRKDIFKLNEGVHAIYKNHTVILLAYNNRADADTIYNEALAYLTENERFSPFAQMNDYSVIHGDKGNRLFLKIYGPYIIIVITRQQPDIDQIFNAIERRIDLGDTDG